MMAEQVPSLGKTIKQQFEETEQIQNRRNPKKSTLTQIKIKFLKTKDEEKSHESNQRERMNYM